jgi:catechol 2,3-dioxygenase-like lactoylglutathione lyase family enzyme
MTVAVSPAKVRTTDMKFELAVIPVSDVERAKQFYANLGWRFDAEFTNGNDFHILQFTPPGSGASVIFGKNVTPAKPGSSQGLYLVVSDIEVARKDLLARGIKVSEIFHGGDSVYTGTDEPYLFGSVRVSGLDLQRRTYHSFASFSDPDGNGWVLQEVTNRLPGRVEGDTTFSSVSDLAATLRRAAAAHGEHEKRNGGVHDVNWPDWYAEYIVNEQAGKPLPQ